MQLRMMMTNRSQAPIGQVALYKYYMSLYTQSTAHNKRNTINFMIDYDNN